MPDKITDVAKAVDEMVASLGLDKLAADSGEPKGESAGTIADSGTTHPAEQETGRSNIQPATEGSQSAENISMGKEEVPGQTPSEANADDAENAGAESSSENITTATFVGEDPAVEDGYGSKGYDAGTTHPADLNKDPEKYSALLLDGATLINAEVEKLAAAAGKAPGASATEGNTTKEADGQEDQVTIADLICNLSGLDKTASADDKNNAVSESVGEFLTGYVKAASIIGDLTADVLDMETEALAKKANEAEEVADGGAVSPPEEEAAPAPEGEVMPAEGEARPAEGEVMPAEGDMGMDGGGAEAAALAQAAEEIAAELGVSPEEVLAAAAAQLEGGGGEGGMGYEGDMSGEMAAPAELAGMAPAEGGMPMEVQAGHKGKNHKGQAYPAGKKDKKDMSKDPKYKKMYAKAAAFDALTAKIEEQKTKRAEAQNLADTVKTAVEQAIKGIQANVAAQKEGA